MSHPVLLPLPLWYEEESGNSPTHLDKNSEINFSARASGARKLGLKGRKTRKKVKQNHFRGSIENLKVLDPKPEEWGRIESGDQPHYFRTQ